MGKRFGYARVSTVDQDLAVQRAALVNAGVHDALIFEEKVTGTKLEGRKELNRLLALLGDGDSLVVTRLDRLGRSLKDLAHIADAITQKGAGLVVTEQHVDTTTSAGKAFFGMLAVFAQFETDVRRDRQLEGIARAKGADRNLPLAERTYRGGKKRLDRENILALAQGGLGPTAIARELGVGRTSVYRVLDEVGGLAAVGGS